MIVFTEVRQRRSDTYGNPLERLTPRKMALLSRAALHYLAHEHHHDDLPCRFDVVDIRGSEAGGS